MMHHLGEIMNISWKDRIIDKVILEKADQPPMAHILIQMNQRCLGHVERMDFARPPRQLLYSQLRDGKRNQGRPGLRFKDIVKRNLKRKKILVDSRRQQAKERTTCTNLIKA